MKEKYEGLNMEVIEFGNEDIITASPPIKDGDVNDIELEE